MGPSFCILQLAFPHESYEHVESVQFFAPAVVVRGPIGHACAWDHGTNDGLDGKFAPFGDGSALKWDHMQKPGLRGWFSLLVCVKWWGAALQVYDGEDKAERVKDWNDLLQDMTRVVELL